MSLNILAFQLGKLGRREEALAAAEEAVDTNRELAAARPDAFRPELARSLNNLAIRLRELGRREEALAAAEEAVDIRQELAARWPHAHQHELRRSLQVAASLLEPKD
jgi:tetratricopeptide (TPR) repeat protein